MSDAKWQRVREVFDSALSRKPEERQNFVNEACGDDKTLLAEVESLLSSHDSAESFMETPAVSHVAHMIEIETKKLEAGKRFGHYEIIKQIGAGGMGEVYLAKDTRLERKTAIKILPGNVAQDEERMLRFVREAKSASALNHPNIITIYEIGETDGTHFIATEYIEGETLRKRLKGSPVNLKSALEIAIQVASALDAAHRTGIVHRDIKPENVMIRPDGLVKILDFGIAKLSEPPEAADGLSVNDSEAATTIKAYTTPGMIIGTAAYMSPEQARGLAVDARTDIWSLGVLLYEMVAGCLPFEGQTNSDVISSILQKEPPALTWFSEDADARLDEIVTKALTKDEEERYQTAKDFFIDLKRLKHRLNVEAEIERTNPKEVGSTRGGPRSGISHSISSSIQRAERQPAPLTTEGELATIGPARVTPALSAPGQRARSRRAIAAWLVACSLLSLLIVGTVVVWQRLIRPVPARELAQQQLTANTAENHLLAAAISPDGKYLAYSDQKGTHLQLIQTGQMHTVAAPEQFVASNLNWLADGTGILASGERGGSSSSIWLISILGGSPRKLRDDAAAPVASPDGSLIAFLGDLEADAAHGIWLMDINGENARRVLSAPPGEQFFRVRWVPDGQRLACTQSVLGLPGLGTEVLESVSLNGGLATAILTQAGLQDFYWLPDGRILYSISQEDFVGANSNLWEIQTESRSGKAGHPEQLTNWAGFSFTDFSSTRDGKRLAFLKLSSEVDVYIGALEQNGTRLKTPRRLTMDERNDWPIEWASDGRAIVFWSNRNGTWDIFKQRIDQETAEMIPAGTEPKWYGHFSPDGAWFLYMALPKKQIPVLSLPVKIMRVPVSGGPPELVLNATGTTSFRCARALPNLCVFNEVVGNRTVFTSFDPVKGKGHELTRVNSLQNVGGGAFDLSPDGSRLAIAQFDSHEGRIRLVSLTDGTASDLDVKGWNHFEEIDWAPDGRGLYVSYVMPQGDGILYVDLQGHARLLWQQQQGLGTCGRRHPTGDLWQLPAGPPTRTHG
jgi:serine/threonine protein kinase/Tol biopolymer transport system component